MIGTIVNLIRYIKGEKFFNNWSEKDMFYVLTHGDIASWLHIRRQVKYREKIKEQI